MKKLIKLVEENFQELKSNFYKAEREIILELDDDQDEIDDMLNNLDKHMNISTPLELIQVINERSGFDGDINNKEDCEELFENIKSYLE